MVTQLEKGPLQAARPDAALLPWALGWGAAPSRARVGRAAGQGLCFPWEERNSPPSPSHHSAGHGPLEASSPLLAHSHLHQELGCGWASVGRDPPAPAAEAP